MDKMLKSKYSSLLNEIKELVEQARHHVVRVINTELLFTYWNVGRLISEKEKEAKFDESSSRQMFIDLSKELTRELGKGFSRSNLFAMQNFYLRFSINDTVQTLSGQEAKQQKGANSLLMVSWEGMPLGKDKNYFSHATLLSPYCNLVITNLPFCIHISYLCNKAYLNYENINTKYTR